MFDPSQTQDAIWATLRPVDPYRQLRNDAIAFVVGRQIGRIIRKRVLKTK